MSDDDIRELRKDIAEIKRSVSKMDNHIDFIDSVYNRFSPVLNFLSFRYNNEVAPRELPGTEDYETLSYDVRSISDFNSERCSDTQTERHGEISEITNEVSPTGPVQYNEQQYPNNRRAMVPVMMSIAGIAGIALLVSKKN